MHKKSISTPRSIKYGKVEFDQKWFRPDIERVNSFISDIKELPDYSKFKFIISGSFLSYIVGKNMEPVGDLDFIIVGDRELPYESIREMLWSVVNIGCGKHKMPLDTYFMYLDDYIEHGTSSICNPSNDILNQYRRNNKIELRSITKKSLTSWNTMYINGKYSPHADVKEEVHPGLWACEKYLPTAKHVRRLNAGYHFGNELLVEEYLSQY